MSLRKQAKILGVSPAHLSRMVNGIRPWNAEIRTRYEELVGNTFGNTQQFGNTSASNHEHAPCTHNTPDLATKSMYNTSPSHCGAVAHLGERFNGIEEVWGSSPRSSTIPSFRA